MSSSVGGTSGAPPSGSIPSTTVSSTAGGSPLLSPSSQEIPDTEDPISFIADEVRRAANLPAGQELPSVKDFKLKGNFVKEGKAYKAFPYSNPPGPYCYSFKREWEVTFKDPAGQEKSLKFSKMIYTNVEIPTSYDGGEHAEKAYMAGMAASLYSDIVQEAIKARAGQASGPLYDRLKSQISKIGRDRFVVMEFYVGKEQVHINPRKNLIETLKGRKPHTHLSNRQITHVKFLVRPGNKKDPSLKENEPASREVFDLSQLEKIQAAAGSKISYQARFKNRKYILQGADQTLPVNLQQLAKIQQSDFVDAELKDGKSLPEALGNAGISSDVYWDAVSGENKKLQGEWENRYQLLHDTEALQSLMKQYGKGQPLSQNIQNLFNPKKSFFKKIQAKISSPKGKKDPHPLISILNAALQNVQDPAEKKELESILESCRQAANEMQTIHQEIAKNEKKLAGLNIVAARQEELEGAMNRRQQITNEILSFLNPTP